MHLVWVRTLRFFANRRLEKWMESDLVYFRKRASEERTAALGARSPKVRRAHCAMADRYEDLVRAMAAAEQRLEVGGASTSCEVHV